VATTSPPITTPLAERNAAQPAASQAAGPTSGRVTTWLLIAVVVAVVVELTCRVEDWVMYRMPLASPYRSLDDLVVRDAQGMHGRPNAQFEKWTMNALGMRGPSAATAPPAGTVRVVTVGASETFGLRESVGKEYPRQLEDSLNTHYTAAACAGGPRRFEVLNAAFAGMSLPTIEQDVRLRLAALSPAIIVIYPTPAGYLDDRLPEAAIPDSSGRPTATASASRAFYPRALGRLREQIKQIVPEVVRTALRGRQTRAMVAAHPPGWRFESVPAERVERYDADLRKLIGTIRRVGATPVLVTHANEFMGRPDADEEMLVAWEKFYPRATGSTIIAMDSVARRATVHVGADSGVVIVDAAQTLAAASLSSFADFVHFTDRGAAIMANAIRVGVLSAACGAPVAASQSAGTR
jgi:hypothetical protein